MASFIPSKHDANEYNNGVQYVNGDGTQPQTINNLVESALYTQGQVVVSADVSLDGTSQEGRVYNLEFTRENGGKFSAGTFISPNGEKGEKGDKGNAGVSPTITVAKNTETEYQLKIQDANSSFLTPNLKGASGESGNKMHCYLVSIDANNASVVSLIFTELDVSYGSELEEGLVALKKRQMYIASGTWQEGAYNSDFEIYVAKFIEISANGTIELYLSSAQKAGTYSVYPRLKTVAISSIGNSYFYKIY